MLGGLLRTQLQRRRRLQHRDLEASHGFGGCRCGAGTAAWAAVRSQRRLWQRRQDLDSPRASTSCCDSVRADYVSGSRLIIGKGPAHLRQIVRGGEGADGARAHAACLQAGEAVWGRCGGEQAQWQGTSTVQAMCRFNSHIPSLTTSAFTNNMRCSCRPSLCMF